MQSSLVVYNVICTFNLHLGPDSIIGDQPPTPCHREGTEEAGDKMSPLQGNEPSLGPFSPP